MTIRLFISTLLLFIVSFNVKSQNLQEADQIKFDETLKWLESWLSYAYYNAESDVNWSSRFFYNAKDHTISLRSVSTDSPNKAIKQKVLDRTVRLDHLDAHSITLNKVDQNRGRIVEGTSIKINTIGQEREIQRSFNGSTSVKESSMEIPIPKYFEDSVQDLSNKVRENLTLAIDLASKLYPTQDLPENINILLGVLTGSFEGSDGSVRNYKNILKSATESDEMVADVVMEKEIIGYDEQSKSFYRWVIRDQKTQTTALEMDTTEELSLFSKETSYKLTIHGKHSFTLEKSGTTVEYYRTRF